jgi:hypothetical protein
VLAIGFLPTPPIPKVFCFVIPLFSIDVVLLCKVDDVDRRRVVKGHGAKAKQQETELETIDDLAVVVNARWQNLP